MGEGGNNDSSTHANQLENKIIRQVEYYFGDKNLPRDKFLQDKINQENGWVSLECLITFNRLKILSTDFDVILGALEKSKTGLLELDKDNKKIRRNPQKEVPSTLDPIMMKASKQKTLYVKGFPTDYTLDQVEEFFEGKGETIFIKMRRDGENFKGSVFVEFATTEMAKKFLDMEDLKIGDTVLLKMTRDDYYKKKDEEKKSEKKNKSNTDGQKEEEVEDPFVKGCVIYFNGAGEGTSREDLKALFGEHHEISWVDFNRNDTEGHVRFKEEGAAQKAIDAVKTANDDKVMIKGVEATVRILEGDEEKAFWEKSQKEREMLRQKRGKGKRKPVRYQKRTRHSAGSGSANGEQKPTGKHKRFDDDEEHEQVASEEKPNAKESKEKQSEDEPAVKKGKTE
ncbi:lupus La protein-like [Rhopilema esculentum]|uniref:lupus La protein-like n=1 Tax=Rhopilema esculentum TaxID=499914 RepID=UPI0031E141E1